MMKTYSALNIDKISATGPAKDVPKLPTLARISWPKRRGYATRSHSRRGDAGFRFRSGSIP